MFNPKWIEGKTIRQVNMRPFKSWMNKRARYKEMANDPLIIFTDGSSITFSTQETEVGEYGTSINYRRPLKE